MTSKILCHSLELELLHGFVSCLVQRRKPYPGRVLISLWCDYYNKNLHFLRFRILADISVLLILAIIMLTGPEKIVRRIVFYF